MKLMVRPPVSPAVMVLPADERCSGPAGGGRQELVSASLRRACFSPIADVMQARAALPRKYVYLWLRPLDYSEKGK